MPLLLVEKQAAEVDAVTQTDVTQRPPIPYNVELEIKTYLLIVKIQFMIIVACIVYITSLSRGYINCPSYHH